MSEQLIKQFLAVINRVSYHNAAEGDSYWTETQSRNTAKQELVALKQLMVAEYGKAKTLEVANSEPHLLYSELSDLIED